MYKDEKFWDRIAPGFDRIEKNDISYRIFIDKAQQYLKADNRVLDFGCGTGLICNEIAENVEIVHAVDISTKMIEIAKTKASQDGIRNIDFARTTIFDDKFKIGSFDAVIAFNVFHLLEEPQKHFKRLYEILKPGGLILSSTPCMSEAYILNTILMFTSFIGITPELNAFTSAKLEQMLINEPFKILEFHRIKPKSPIYVCILEKQ